MFKKKSFEEVAKELDRELQKEGWATDYNDLRTHVSDNAYLYYLNHKVGHTNKTLKEIRDALFFLIGILAAIAARLYGWL